MSMRYQAGIVLPGYNALKVANAPTIGTATDTTNGATVSVAFTAPSCTGGSVISTYTVYANCGIKTTTGASSPLVVTGLTNGTAYTFKVVATNIFGPSHPSVASNSVTPTLVVIGQQAYTSAGTYSWVAPANVTSVSIVAVGAGGQGGARAGGGGGLRYKNNLTVIPANSYSVVVGLGGSYCGVVPGGDSSFNSTSVIGGGGGSSAFGTGSAVAGGQGTGDGGGNGGCGGGSNGGFAGGGGAGGYAGNGGYGAYGGGSVHVPVAGQGGGGGGGGNNNCAGSGGGGGGVGLLGQGANGAAGAYNTRGGGGSGGVGGSVTSAGGAYGGGGGASAGTPSAGAVRIIWPGTTRSFPSTCTGDL